MIYLLDFFKGIIIGLFMLVPGISGGSIAIILGLYERLLCSVNDLFKSFKNNFIFLLVVALGGVVGIFISSFIFGFFIENFYNEMLFIFIGIMLYHSFNSFVKIENKHIFKSLIYVLVGLFIGFLLTKIPIDFFVSKNHYLTLLILGIFLAIALILPGVSVSYVLLIFNIYDDLINAIKSFDYLFLLEVGLSLIIGTIIVIKFLHYLIIKKNDVLSNVIIGFIFSSIWMVMPKIYNLNELVYCLIFIIIGIIIKKVIPNDN